MRSVGPGCVSDVHHLGRANRLLQGHQLDATQLPAATAGTNSDEGECRLASRNGKSMMLTFPASPPLGDYFGTMPDLEDRGHLRDLIKRSRSKSTSVALRPRIVALMPRRKGAKGPGGHLGREIAQHRAARATANIAGRLRSKLEEELEEAPALLPAFRLSLFFCWRPRRDLNPCYRRERTTSISKSNDLQEAGGHLSPC